MNLKENLKEIVEKRFGTHAKDEIVAIRAETINEDGDKIESFAEELCKKLGIKKPDKFNIFCTQCWGIFKHYDIPVRKSRFEEFYKAYKFTKKNTINNVWGEKCGTYYFPECTGYVYDLLQAKMNVLLTGPKGCGKTELAEIMFRNILGVPFETIDISQRITIEHLEGQMTLVDGKTVWQDGSLARACRNQNGIIFNEIDAADEDLATGMMELFQKHSYTIIQTGERINAENSLIIATSNTLGDGSNEMYTRQFIDKAFLSRIIPIHMDYPKKEVEIKILNEIAPNVRMGMLDKLVDFATWTRNEHKDGSLTDCISTRELVQCVTMLNRNERWDSEASIKICLCNRYAGHEHIMVCAKASSIFGIRNLEENNF